MEFLLHAIAACVTTSMIYHAAARGIQIEAVKSPLEGDSTCAASSEMIRRCAMATSRFG